MGLNLFLRTHKCGNKYTEDVHRLWGVPLVQAQPAAASAILAFDKPDSITNVRCRNFGYDILSEAQLLDNNNTRMLAFTRHPASFVHSATLYHLRGDEKWTHTLLKPHFGGKTHAQALQDAKSEAARQIVTMVTFKTLYEKQASLAALFDAPNCLRVRTEDLFTSTDPEYYQNIAKFLRLEGDENFVQALKDASPAFRTKLPSHSTSAFQLEDPYTALVDEARAYYDEHFAGFATRLGY